MEVERSLGFEPTDRELDKLGYDIESRVPGTGKLRFIEVKRRVSGAATITVTRNEILYFEPRSVPAETDEDPAGKC
jgi:Protein NO VEIN, C-terminal